MSLLDIVLLGLVQGLAELLPVSSSAHVVVTEKLLGLDPSSPEMTLVLVMLHTGTMFAVIVYFWRQWRAAYFSSLALFRRIAARLALATVLTGIVYEILLKLIEGTALRGRPVAEIEDLFGRLDFIAPALAAAGVLILVAGLLERRRAAHGPNGTAELGLGQTAAIGIVQGFCLPFRGFSRSGATISTGMLAGVPKSSAEAFSFALAVILTPPAFIQEAQRLARASRGGAVHDLGAVGLESLLGALVAFAAGLLALRWLSRWLEHGRWYFFGIYCLAAAAAVAVLYRVGY